jgi:hypothetical protein
MRICTAPGAVNMRMEKCVDDILGFLVFYDITIVLFHVVQFHICTEKIPVNPRAEAYVGFMRTRTKRTRGQENRT